MAVVGRERILELADRPIVWIWDYIATAGLVVLLAAGPGSGKTTLLFLLIVARANRGAPVKVLGRTITPAAEGKWVVIIENEHSDESAARILRKSCDLLGVSDSALDRVVLVARGNVRIGSRAWGDVETLIAAGLVSDLVLDTLARCAPFDANDEQEQVEVFSRIAQAIERAPTADTRPGVWLAAHTRKCDGPPSLDDVSGSAQRTGQADVVLLMGAQRSGDRVSSVKVAFGKVREKDAEDWPAPVEYIVKKNGVVLVGAQGDDGRPLEERILARLEVSGPFTANALGKTLGRSNADVQGALSNLFAAKRLSTTTVRVRGKDFKAFTKRTTMAVPVSRSTETDEPDDEPPPKSWPDFGPTRGSAERGRTSPDVRTGPRKTGSMTPDGAVRPRGPTRGDPLIGDPHPATQRRATGDIEREAIQAEARVPATLGGSGGIGAPTAAPASALPAGQLDLGSPPGWLPSKRAESVRRFIGERWLLTRFEGQEWAKAVPIPGSDDMAIVAWAGETP